MSYFVDEDTLAKTVTAKANGDHRDGYKAKIQPESSKIVRGILRLVPTQAEIIRIMRNSGLPVVGSDSMHLQENFVEATKTQVKSCAIRRELTECIRAGDIVRVPCFVSKGKAGGAPYHRAYMYVDADADIPNWWPRGLNEKGSIASISYVDYKNRARPTEPEAETFVQRAMAIMPDAPTPDLTIVSYATPGTVSYIMRTLGIPNNKQNYKNAGNSLYLLYKSGTIGCVKRKCMWSDRQYNVYYRK